MGPVALALLIGAATLLVAVAIFAGVAVCGIIALAVHLVVRSRGFRVELGSMPNNLAGSRGDERG